MKRNINNLQPALTLRVTTLLFTCMLTLFSFAQKVIIKDQNFEKALIALKIDTDGLNGSVSLGSVDTVTNLVITNKGIADLSGIESFKNLVNLYCDSNELDYLILTSLPKIEVLSCSYNMIKGLDLSFNKNIRILNASHNSLNSLNIANGSNSNIVNFDALENKDLSEICVDDATFANQNFNNKDSKVSFNDAKCNTGIIQDMHFEEALVNQKLDLNGITMMI